MQEQEADLNKLEKELEDTDDFNEVPPEDIVAYNELRSCADLFRMYEDGQLDIQPDFQREIVWNNSMQTRLVDSVVKQLPIPSLCISLDYKTQSRFVIDGLQRIASIVKFINIKPTSEWRLSNLDDIDSRISGKSNINIKGKYPELFNKLLNTVIPITVLRCDYSKKSHMNYLFTIFHRLNTGGSKLSNQEIRNCIFNGPFNTFLKACVEYDNYVALFDVDQTKIDRFSNEELILRFLSFSDVHATYKGKLAKFLNDYMDSHKNDNPELIESFQNNFQSTIDIIYTRIKENAPLPKLSKATTEALFVGVSKNIDHLGVLDNNNLKQKFQNLLDDDLFSIDSLKEGLAQRDKVINRINRAIEIFSA